MEPLKYLGKLGFMAITLIMLVLVYGGLIVLFLWTYEHRHHSVPQALVVTLVAYAIVNSFWPRYMELAKSCSIFLR